MQKKQKIISAIVIAIIAAPVIFVVTLFNVEALQNRLAVRALDRNLAAQFVQSQSYGGDNLDVVFCGTASPMGQSDRAQQCIGVLAGDRFFLVDSGARSAAKAAAVALPLGRLDGILLTHFHSDHIAALGEMHLQSWVQGRPRKLPVYGGPGVRQVVDGFNFAYGPDYGYRTEHHGADILPPENAGLLARPFALPEVGLKEIYNEGGLVISTFTVPHEPVRPAVGYRFDYKGRSVVVSGDTSKSDGVVVASKNADMLIHEVLQPELVKMTSERLKLAGRDALSKLVTDTLDYHTSPVEAAEVANAANVRLLVFTHFAPTPVNGLVERIFMRGVGDVRDDGVILADDGMHLRLPVGSDDIETLSE